MTTETKPWQQLSEEDRLTWAPRGPWYFCPDGDDIRPEWFTVLHRDHAAADVYSFPYTQKGSLEASFYVAWKNREAAAPSRPEAGPDER